MASYPSTAQSSDFVNAVPTGPFRPAKEKTPENLEETQTPLFRNNVVFSLQIQIKMGGNGDLKASSQDVFCALAKCFVFGSEPLFVVFKKE